MKSMKSKKVKIRNNSKKKGAAREEDLGKLQGALMEGILNDSSGRFW